MSDEASASGAETRNRWRRIDAILDASLELPADVRRAYVATACNGDMALEQEVVELLAATDAPATFLSTPAAERAAPLVVDLVPDPAVAAPFGRIVGRYRLLNELGEGGMGCVYLAERADGAFEQRVAIKIAKYGLYSSDARRRFLQERQILARLEHPAIARLLDGGVTEEGTPFFVMEYVEGQPLTSYCREHATSTTERLNIFLNVCEAVRYAHANLVVHRDLKPSNVLVDQTGHVKLLDFGIAKLLGDDVAAGTQTIARALTPEYASPEQLRGEPVSTATDVYALGVVLYELLTGERPERSANGSFTRRQRLRGDLEHVVPKALEPATERRYASVEAFARDVERHIQGKPVSAQGDALVYRVRKFLRRHRVGVAAAAAILVMLVGGLVTTTWQARRAEREARKAEAVRDFLKTLLSAADPVTAKGHEPSVRQLVDAGAARIETDLRDQPDVQSEVARVIATVYQSLGQYDRIPPLLAADLERRRRLDGPRSVAVAELLTQIADARYEQNQYRESGELYAEALSIQRERRGPRAPAVAELLWDLAGVARNQGDLTKAESMLHEALDIYVATKGADSSEAQNVRVSLAITYGQSGRFAEGQRLMEEMVAWAIRHQGIDHPDTLTSQYNLAFAWHDVGRTAEALTLIDDVIVRQRRVIGPRHDRLAVSLRLRARLLDAAGRCGEAQAPIAEALDIQSEEFGDDNLQVAADRSWQAVINSHCGRLDEAEQGAREALRVFDRVSPPPANVPPIRARLGIVLADCGRLDEADAQIARAIADLRAAGRDDPHVQMALEAQRDVERRRAAR